MSWKKCEYEEIRKLKSEYLLTLRWEEPEKCETIRKYEIDNRPIAFIKTAPDPDKEQTIWIKEFEVIIPKKRQGYGKKAIAEYLNEVNVDVSILAKNKCVQSFWEKCGFIDDGITWAEIPMVYKTR